MNLAFDYQDGGFCRFGKIFRPMAEVSLYSQNYNKWLKIWMVVDTGADFSILPKYLAKSLDVSLSDDCFAEETYGIGGNTRVYLVKKLQTVKLDDTELRVPLAFSSDDDVPPIMGRLGFIDSFNIEFTVKRRVYFRR